MDYPWYYTDDTYWLVCHGPRMKLQCGRWGGSWWPRMYQRNHLDSTPSPTGRVSTGCTAWGMARSEIRGENQGKMEKKYFCPNVRTDFHWDTCQTELSFNEMYSASCNITMDRNTESLMWRNIQKAQISAKYTDNRLRVYKQRGLVISSSFQKLDYQLKVHLSIFQQD